MRTLFFFFTLWGLTSCTKHYVAVSQISVGKSSLASTFAKTPDPRKQAPPRGKQLLIEWNLPTHFAKETLFLELQLIYGDLSEETLKYALEGVRGEISYFLLGEKYQKTQGLFTYKALIKTSTGDIVKEFTQGLFVKILPLDQEEASVQESAS
ncbi:MAG: hypothetical protein FJZ63_00665 [Chlamydiae bacterium]|nr:hypothetical protein [Chlamydiota bacterium]